MKAKTTFSLKDQLFNPEKVAYLADLITAAHPSFPSADFQTETVSRFPELELKQRIGHITACLQRYLPQDYAQAIDIILQALPPELDPTKTDNDFGDFIFAPLSYFAAEYGNTAEHLALSLHALEEITKRFSAEDAIRFFLNQFPDETFAFLDRCAKSDNYHVRRLASEGTRPKLPWSQKLNIDYKEPLPLLDQLFSDHTRYVTRSVANHLNDISKIDPALVVETLTRWQKSGRQHEKEMSYIIKHSLRTLVKKGDKAALDLLGFGAEPDVKITKFATSTPLVQVGDALLFSLSLTAQQSQNLLIDYVMDFAGGGRKVFKLKQLSLESDQTKTIKKKHPMRLMTTRRLNEGEHRIILQINGRPFQSLTFELVAPAAD